MNPTVLVGHSHLGRRWFNPDHHFVRQHLGWPPTSDAIAIYQTVTRRLGGGGDPLIYQPLISLTTQRTNVGQVPLLAIGSISSQISQTLVDISVDYKPKVLVLMTKSNNTYMPISILNQWIRDLQNSPSPLNQFQLCFAQKLRPMDLIIGQTFLQPC